MDHLPRDRRYILENRYQDSNWQRLNDESYDLGFDAKTRAMELSKDSICYGMVRAIDMEQKKVIGTYTAGHPV